MQVGSLSLCVMHSRAEKSEVCKREIKMDCRFAQFGQIAEKVTCRACIGRQRTDHASHVRWTGSVREAALAHNDLASIK